MTRLLFSLCIALSIYPNLCSSRPLAIAEWQLTGSALHRFAWWDIYTAELFTPDGDYHADRPFALKLTYHKDFKGDKIADRTIKEIQQQDNVPSKQLKYWSKLLPEVFPNVDNGDHITGIKTEDGFTEFFFNNKYIATIKNPDFSEHFFDIWLGKHTSEPELRNKLTGNTKR